MSLEVGRIIRGFGRASTFNFSYLKYSRRRPYQGHQVAATTHSAPVRSSAARAAHRRQASSYICFGPIIPEPLARAPWVYGWSLQRSGGATFDIEWNTQGVARQWHRLNWPETNVGAGLPAMRRAGGARSHWRQRNKGGHLSQPMLSRDGPWQPHLTLKPPYPASCQPSKAPAQQQESAAPSAKYR